MELNSCPPLVSGGEAERLKSRLARAARGEAFVLHAGADAEAIDGVTADAVRDTLKTMLQMSTLLTYALSVPVVKISRIGRTCRDNCDPPQMMRGYQSAAACLNLVRAFTTGGYADLRQVHAWNRDFVAHSPAGPAYAPLTTQIGRALSFMRACGSPPEKLGPVEFFASHEGVVPRYASALTRTDPLSGRRHDTSGHLVWTGGSRRDPDGEHLDHLAAIDNPIGVVLGPDSGPDDAVAYLDRLDPDREPGRLTFIVRMGARAVRDRLPALIEKVVAQDHHPAWICDPVRHGAPDAPAGEANRRFADVVEEVKGFFEVHRELGTHPGGIHIELAGTQEGDRVDGGLERHAAPGTAGASPLAAPRLTHAGSLDLAFLIAEMYRSAAPAPWRPRPPDPFEAAPV